MDYVANGRIIDLTEAQKNQLEENFQCNQVPRHHEIFAIAYCLLLPEKAVKDWFKHHPLECCMQDERVNLVTVRTGTQDEEEKRK